VRVVIADDSVLFREGLARLLEDAGIEVVARVGSAAELSDVVAERRPDLLVVDIRMPPTHTDEGLVAANQLRQEHPGLPILVLSHHVETNHAVRLLADGAGGIGYLLKDRVSDVSDFMDVLRRLASGGSVIDPEVVTRLIARRRVDDPLEALSQREREVLNLMAQGRSNKAICDQLVLSPKTLETHVGNIFTKLGLLPTPDDHRRVLAVLTCLRGA
jgi:DNA-binding NarL/FixJ family response regulator